MAQKRLHKTVFKSNAWVTGSSLCAALSFAAPQSNATGTDNGGTNELDEIIVTGSHIHGAVAAGSKPTVITREQIDASGYGRIEDVLARVTLNSNRTNAATRDGNEVNNYDNRGTEVQLRGLGLGTTLTLVDGQRQGASGYQGSFIDVSSIPAAAIERVEILPEGSSALYGADAIGGVVNIILRKDFEGTELRARASTADGDAAERTVAALWGHSGSDGHVLLGLQYDDSRALLCRARSYCAANGDLRRFGGSDQRTIGGNPGTIIKLDDEELTAAIPRGQDGSHLLASQLIRNTVNHSDGVIGNDLLPQQIVRGAFLNAAIELSSRWELSINGRYSARDFESSFPQPTRSFTVPTSNSYNHFGVPATIAYDFTADVGPVIDRGRTDTSFLSVGLKGSLSRGWQLRLTAAYSQSSTHFFEYNNLNADAVNVALGSGDPATALNLFGDGSHSPSAALGALRNQSVVLEYPDRFNTSQATVVADGSLFTGPAGPIRLAVGGDFRREHSVGFNIGLGLENRGRDATAVFAEFAIPLVAARTGSTAEILSLSLAGRHDRYDDAGSSFNPKVGLSWRPLERLNLRANWGTSFRAPPFFWSNPDLKGDAYVADIFDPTSPNHTARALALVGTGRDLKPERSTSWSIGADLRPNMTPNLSLSGTYFDIDYRGKIRNVGVDSADFLTQEAPLSSLITRNPTPAQIAAACQDITRFLSNSTGDCRDPITVIIDARFRNLARVRTRGLDFGADYTISSARGKWSIGLNGTYTISLNQQITPTAPVFEISDTVGNPLKLRLSARLAWSSGAWSVQTTANHSGAYQDLGFTPSRRVGSWTTVDLNAGYRVDGGDGWLSGTQCNLGVINLLNRSPPFVNQFDPFSGNFGYDAANASLLGRQISLQIVKRWGP